MWRGVQDGRVGPRRDVVAVEADVQVAERQLTSEQLLQQLVQAPGEDRAATVDADEGRRPDPRDCARGSRGRSA